MTASVNCDEFVALTRPLMPRLFRIGMRLTHRPDQADDLVQEALTRAWTHWDRFNGEGKLGAWLSRILINTFISRHRHQKVVDNAAARPDLVHHLFDPRRLENAARPDADWPQAGLSAPVLEALQALPENYRDVVVLVDVRGLSYKEAASELDCPLGTVMSRLHRARRQLRGELSDYAAEYGLGMAA
jgi:RNA polymerase sigma-70 factor (ECF subfamily)